MASKLHPVFAALKQKNTYQCMKLIDDMDPDELATLKNSGNTSLITVAIDTMNVQLIEKLIDVCGVKIISDLKNRLRVLIPNLIKNASEKRYQIMKQLLEFNDCYIFSVLYANFKDNFPFDTNNLIRKLLDSNDYITIRYLYDEFGYDFIYDKIIERAKAKDDKDYGQYIEAIIAPQIPNNITSKEELVKYKDLMEIVKGYHAIYAYKVVGRLYRYLRQPYDHRIELLDRQKKHDTLPDNIDLQFSLYDPRVPECKELHLSIMTHDKVLFDYFFDHGYHLSEYTINLLDCIIAYEFELFTHSGFYKKIVQVPNDDSDAFGYLLFTYMFADYDIYYMKLEEEMTKMVKDHPEAIGIMDNMMFRDESIYYIMKLLDSPMSKKCNQFTKRMLTKFIVPYKENKLSDQVMCYLDGCEIEHDEGDHKSMILKDVMKQYQPYHCLVCNKLCYRPKHDMMKEIGVYTRTVNPDSQYVYDAVYTNPTKIQISGISFCSMKCQNEFA